MVVGMLQAEAVLFCLEHLYIMCKNTKKKKNNGKSRNLFVYSQEKRSIMKQIHVVAAVIEQDGKILCTQRLRSHEAYNSERWEFPGGKVEEGESDHAALLREIREELDWDIYVGRELCTVTHDYPDFTIVLTAYRCRPGDGDFTLLQHLDARWLGPDELPELNWTEADRKIVDHILTDKP